MASGRGAPRRGDASRGTRAGFESVMTATRRVRVVDSHTAGEPTRVVLEGGPDLGAGPLSERIFLFRDRYDRYRSAIVNEPRGSDVLVGAMLVEPVDSTC